MPRKGKQVAKNPLSRLIDAGIAGLEIEYGGNDGLSVARDALQELADKTRQLEADSPLAKWIAVIQKRIRKSGSIRDFDHAAKLLKLPLRQIDTILVGKVREGILDYGSVEEWREDIGVLFAQPNNKFDFSSFKLQLKEILQDWMELNNNGQ